mmetsp:Transcript_133482/g.198420  ORF Transcript_133482/g.198420 Transcript_133482/m.198420 type:complete len:165 (+) Transcript_133482:1106-1600(+)
MDQWNGGAWSMVSVGSTNFPGNSCGSTGCMYTNIESAEKIAEKPYVIFENGKYYLMVPALETNKKGRSVNYNPSSSKKIDFSRVYVAKDTDSAQTINNKINGGLHIVLSPGIYNLNQPIVVNKADTVILGIGYPTLVSTSGNAVLEVGNVDGVRVAAILAQAGK